MNTFNMLPITNQLFSLFFFIISSQEKNKIEQLIQFWNWIKTLEGKKRNYTYIYCGEETTETLIFKGLKKDKSCGLIAIYRTKTGKKDWNVALMGSPFFKHFELTNRKANKWIEYAPMTQKAVDERNKTMIDRYF